MKPRVATLTERFGEVREVWTPEGGQYKVECPRCPETGRDTKGQLTLSVNLEKGLFHCFRCKWGGTTSQLRVAFQDEAVSLDLTSLRAKLDAKRSVEDTDDILPPGFKPVRASDTSMFGKRVVAYLRGRGLSDGRIDALQAGYTLEGPAEPKEPDYRGRVVVPVTDGKRVIYFVARSWGSSSSKVLYPKGVPRSGILYGLERVTHGSSVTMVEGVFDAERSGPNTVALLGCSLSVGQLYRVLSRFPDVIYFALDPEAVQAARKAVEITAAHTTTELRMVKLPEGSDPADLGPLHMQRLRDASVRVSFASRMRDRLGSNYR